MCSLPPHPLGIEHLTGSLAETIAHFGSWKAPVQLRFTTKYDAVQPLLSLSHQRHTRIRFSVNAQPAAPFCGMRRRRLPPFRIWI